MGVLCQVLFYFGFPNLYWNFIWKDKKTVTLVSEENDILCGTEEHRVDRIVKPIGKIWEPDEADGSISNYLSTCLHLEHLIQNLIFSYNRENLIKITTKEW